MFALFQSHCIQGQDEQPNKVKGAFLHKATTFFGVVYIILLHDT